MGLCDRVRWLKRLEKSKKGQKGKHNYLTEKVASD